MARPRGPAMWDRAQSVASTSRPASSSTSKRKCAVMRSRASSSGVRRSKSSVPMPASCRTRATNWLRGLWRLLPLPWAKRTRASPVPAGSSVPLNIALPDGICASARLTRASHAGGERLRRFLGMLGVDLERLDATRLVEVDHRVELVGEAGPGVMALAFGLGPVDYGH